MRHLEQLGRLNEHMRLMDTLAREEYGWIRSRVASSMVPAFFEEARLYSLDKQFENMSKLGALSQQQEIAQRLLGHPFENEDEARYALTYAQAISLIKQTGSNDIFTIPDDIPYEDRGIYSKAQKLCSFLGAYERGINPGMVEEPLTQRLKTKGKQLIGVKPGKRQLRRVADHVEALLSNEKQRASILIMSRHYKKPDLEITYSPREE